MRSGSAQAQFTSLEGNPQPRSGIIIGHIIEGTYVPSMGRTASNGPDALFYGYSKLVRDVSKDILNDLMEVYDARDAVRILVIAAMRIIRPDIPAMRIGERCRRTFFSLWYPNLTLNENTISTLYSDIGMDCGRMVRFYSLRIAKVAKEHHIAIDGTLKQDTSVVNNLLAYSHKTRVNGCKDVLVLYAYDIERKEPICSEVFQGNFIDATSLSAFINDNHVYKGMILLTRASRQAGSARSFPSIQISTF